MPPRSSLRCRRALNEGRGLNPGETAIFIPFSQGDGSSCALSPFAKDQVNQHLGWSSYIVGKNAGYDSISGLPLQAGH